MSLFNELGISTWTLIKAILRLKVKIIISRLKVWLKAKDEGDVECKKCEFGLSLIYGNPQLYCIYFKDVEPPRCEIINPNGTCHGFLSK